MAKKPNPAARPAKSPTAAAKAATTPATANAHWLRLGWVALAIAAICYLPALSNQFVNWDDDFNIAKNPNLEAIGQGQTWGTTISNIFDIEKGAVIGNYNPLPILTFAIEKAIAGEFSSRLIHFNNILLHLLAVFFAMKLLSAMGLNRWGVLLGGLLFGIHPMRVESVAWATERKDVLFAVFYFAALVQYMGWLKAEDSGRRTRQYLVMLGLALLACLSKVQAVSLPLSMLALDYWHRRPLTFRLLWEKTPFWALSLAFGLINLYTLGKQGSTTDQATLYSFGERLCIGAYSLCTYLYKVVLPYPMLPLYPYPKELTTWIYAAPLGALLAGLALWWVWKSGKRAWVFGSLFFLFNVMFVLQIVGAGQGFLADRFTYVAYFGFFAVAGWYFGLGMEDEKRRGTLLAALAAVGAVCAIWTMRQVGVWKDSAALWSHVIAHDDANGPAMPYGNRAQHYRDKGNYEAALKDYSEALKREPKNSEILNSRGKTQFDMAMSGQFQLKQADLFQRAVADYRAAINVPNVKSKQKAEALANLGAAEGARENYPAAIQALSESIQLDPANENGYLNRSIAYANTKQFDKALADYDAYLKVKPFDANIWYEGGMVQRLMNKNDGAVQYLNRAIQLDPKMGLAYLERARAQMQAGSKAAAQQDYQRAQQMGVRLDATDREMLAK
jgi:protein O-mannosyl-transferase